MEAVRNNLMVVFVHVNTHLNLQMCHMACINPGCLHTRETPRYLPVYDERIGSLLKRETGVGFHYFDGNVSN